MSTASKNAEHNARSLAAKNARLAALAEGNADLSGTANEALAAVESTAPKPVRATWKGHGNPQAIIYHGLKVTGPSDEGQPAIVATVPGRGDIRFTAVTMVDGKPQTGKVLATIGNAAKFWAVVVRKAESRAVPANEPIVGQCHVRMVATRNVADGTKQGETKLSRTFADPGQARGYIASLEATGDWESMEVVGGKTPREALPGRTPGSVSPTQHTRDVRQAASGAPRSARSKKPCRCGCGTMIANLYAQGHDARHVSQLASEYREAVTGNLTKAKLADLLGKLRKRVEFSERLTAKLERSLQIIDEKAAKSDG